MSIGYATQRGLTNSSPMRRWSQMVSSSAPPLTNPAIGMTAQGTAQTSTAQSKFGTASMTTTNNTSYLQNTSGSYTWWPSGTGDFTVQWWQYIPSSVASNVIQQIGSNEETFTGGFGWRLGTGYGSSTINGLNIFARGKADLDYVAYTWARDTWQFVSITRASATIYFHIDGVKQTLSGSGGGTRNFGATSGLNKIEIGRAGDFGINGIYIDDLQIFASTAKYGSADYSPPTSQAMLTTGTTALFLMNGTNGGTSFPNVTSN